MPDDHIRPIRRWYRGVHYRSTLEADWAATLYHLGITYEYETEAYDTPEGPYSPDFWLPAQRVWLEVKGPHNGRVNKAEAFANLLAVAHEQFGSIDEQGTSWWEIQPDRPILVLGMPSRSGLLRLRAMPPFGSGDDVGFACCPTCGHWTIVVAYQPCICRVCLKNDPALYECQSSLSFRRARDDTPKPG